MTKEELDMYIKAAVFTAIKEHEPPVWKAAASWVAILVLAIWLFVSHVAHQREISKVRAAPTAQLELLMTVSDHQTWLGEKQREQDETISDFKAKLDKLANASEVDLEE